MNAVLVRTKLQALIVLRLLQCGQLSKPFAFLPLFRKDEAEIPSSLQDLYARISAHATRTIPLAEEGRLLRTSLRVWVALLQCWLTRGQLFVSSINCYPVALAIRLLPWAEISSFDDGMANVQPASDYFTTTPIAGPQFRRRILRLLLPQGAARYVRSRSSIHYSIYPMLQNIVPAARVRLVRMDWVALLSAQDRLKVDLSWRTLLLGTVYGEHAIDLRDAYERLTSECDAYLPHPRETRRPTSGIRVAEVECPAEAVIEFILRNTAHQLRVFHFNSSVAYSFPDTDRVTFIDVLTPLELLQRRQIG